MAISGLVNSTGSVLTGSAGTGLSQTTAEKDFQSFLTLLTTQLKNQNPLDPLDTHQFTQQLVQFAQVEQQITMNGSLNSLISLQQASQTSAALGFLGSEVRVDGDTARLTEGEAKWNFTATKPASAAITVQSASGQVLYTETRTIAAGPQAFTWNGRDSTGRTWTDGDYKLSIVATDASGQSVAVSTEIDGIVDGVDLSQNPPLLAVGGQNFTLDKIKQVRRAGS